MKPLWSEQQLRNFLGHPSADIRSWAAATLLALYPERAAAELDTLLAATDEVLVRAALAFLRRSGGPVAEARLKTFILTGSDALIQDALEVASNRRSPELVEWLKEKIAAGAPLSLAVIEAMISALGRIPGSAAYDLLKATEGGAKIRSSAYYERYYSALLAHHRAADLDTLLADAFTEHEQEKIRIAALAVLFGDLQPAMRPGDVFFANSTWVNDRLKADTARLRPLVSKAGRELLRGIDGILEELTAQTASALTPRIAALTPLPAEMSAWPALAAGKAMEFLARPEQADDTRYAEAVLVLTAVLAGLEPSTTALLDPKNDWRSTLSAAFQSRPVDFDTDSGWQALVARTDRAELIGQLEAWTENAATLLGRLNAVMALGRLKAVTSVPRLLDVWRSAPGSDLAEVMELALAAMGAEVVPPLLDALAGCPEQIRPAILSVCSAYPTREGVAAFEQHLEDAYRREPDRVLQALAATGSAVFLPFLEREVRTGERALEAAYVRICRLNGVDSQRFREAERDLKRLEKMEAAAAASFRKTRDLNRLPGFLRLKLLCKHCNRSYHYEVGRVHLHPSAPEPLKERTRDDLTPYRQGLVLVDSLQCKHCGTWNEFLLSEEALAEVSGWAMRMVVLRHAGLKIPAGYPLQHVSYEERDGRPLSLVEVEQGLLGRLAAAPDKPQNHLALAKFYEYVKLPAEAKKAYLKALDLDQIAIEAAAGLARLAEAEERFQEAYLWCRRCSDNLAAGHLYLLESLDEFKKTVREKRREYARKAGIRPEAEGPPIRFHIEAAAYPKNRPCPCGSGKKYKLCCMPREGPTTEGQA